MAVEWTDTDEGHPALVFLEDFWSAIKGIAARSGNPSASELVGRIVTDLINHNIRVEPEDSVRLVLEWVKDGGEPDGSPQAILSFQDGTLGTIASLWGESEDRTREFLVYGIVESLKRAAV